jgi:hypothetical protein
MYSSPFLPRLCKHVRRFPVQTIRKCCVLLLRSMGWIIVWTLILSTLADLKGQSRSLSLRGIELENLNGWMSVSWNSSVEPDIHSSHRSMSFFIFRYAAHPRAVFQGGALVAVGGQRKSLAIRVWPAMLISATLVVWDGVFIIWPRRPTRGFPVAIEEPRRAEHVKEVHPTQSGRHFDEPSREKASRTDIDT